MEYSLIGILVGKLWSDEAGYGNKIKGLVITKYTKYVIEYEFRSFQFATLTLFYMHVKS